MRHSFLACLLFGVVNRLFALLTFSPIEVMHRQNGNDREVKSTREY